MIITKKNRLILLLFCFICYVGQAQTTDPSNIQVVFCGYMDAFEDIKEDNNLDFTSIRVQFYQTTEWGQRIGGFLSILMSSSEVIEAEHEDIYGGVFAGILIGQELRLWRFTFGINLLVGAGASVSNLRRSPRHTDFFSEVNIDIGVTIAEGFHLSSFAGLQCIGNLFPELPGTDYLLYYPVWGIILSF